MLNISNQAKIFIRANFENAEQLFKAKNINDILDPLYDLIVYQGFDENYDYNDFGREAQKIYDELYYNN